MNQSFDQSHQDIEVKHSQQVNQHQTIFQKYSKQGSNNKNYQNQNQIRQSHNVRQQSTPNDMSQKQFQSNFQILSEEGEKSSLIEKVEKYDFLNQSVSLIQQGTGFVGVPQSQSKIYHQPILNHQNSHPLQQPFNHVFQQKAANTQFNQANQFKNQYQTQQNNLRSTIDISQNVSNRNNNLISGNQQINVRGSLPPNMIQPQFPSNQPFGVFYVTQTGNSQYQALRPSHLPQSLITGQHQNQGNLQSVNVQNIQSQYINIQNNKGQTLNTQNSQRQLSQNISGNNSGAPYTQNIIHQNTQNIMHQQNQNAVSIQNAQNIGSNYNQTVVQKNNQNYIVQNNQNQINYVPVDFIQQGQQKLQRSEIVYKNRNPNINNNQFMALNHYRNQQQQSNSQPHRGQGLNSGQENRSLEKRTNNANIFFNYNAQGNNRIINNSPQIIQQQRPASLSPIPINLPINTVKLTQVAQNQHIVSQPIIQPVIQQSVISKNLLQKQVRQTQTNWKQRYFALFNKFSSLNKKVQYITESFFIYEKLIQTVTIKQEKVITKHKKLKHILQELQQQCAQIYQEWRPQIQKIPSQNQKKQQGHLQMKYKRLLVNFSKLQQENVLVKKTLERKIIEVVQKLQNQNTLLKKTLQNLTSQNNSLTIQFSKLTNQNNGMKARFENLTAQSNAMKQKFSKISNEVQVQNKIIKRNSFQYLRSSAGMTQQNQPEKTQSLETWIRNISEIMQTVEQHNEQMEERFNSMQAQIQEKNQMIFNLQQILSKKNSEPESTQKIQHLGQSDDLTLSMSQKFQLEQRIAKYHQKSIFLQGQIERLTQKNENLTAALEQKQDDLKFQNSQRPNIQNIQQIISELNFKIEQYQHRINQFQQQTFNLNNRNQSLERQLEQNKSQTLILPPTVIADKDNSQYLKQVEFRIKQNSELQIQKASLQQKNTTLRDQLERLNSKTLTLETQLRQSRQIQSQQSQQVQHSPLIIQQYQFSISSLRSQIMRKQTQLERQSKLSDQRILDLTQQLKLSYKERQASHKRYQQKITLIEGERDKKELLIRQLRDKIYQVQQRRKLDENQENRRNQYINKMASLNENQQISKLRNELQALKTQKERIAKDYQLQSKKLEDENQQIKQDNLRLKKQIGDLANTAAEIQNLTQILSKKNMQILQLKNISFENEKLIVQITNSRRQIERQIQQNNRFATENDKLNKSNIEITRNLRDVEQNLNGLNLKFNSVRGQYDLVMEANNRKDSQIKKLLQANQLLQTNVDQIERQNQKLKVKVRTLQVTFDNETTLLKEQIQSLKTKTADYDKVIRQKSVSNHRIAQLQSLVQKYEYQLKQNFELLTKQKSKVKTLQSQNQDFIQQVQSITEKFKEQDKKSAENIKKYKKLLQELQDKNKALQQKQIKFEKQKIAELEHDLKSKQNKVWKLQKQVQELLQRLDQVGDQEIDSQKIAILQQKVKQYESRLFNQISKYTPTNYDYQATKVFERQVIYELKEENERLRQFISQKKSLKPTKDQSQSKAELKIKQIYDEQLDQVQGRLLAFNTKLESLINNGNYENVETTFKKSQKNPLKVQTDNPQTLTNNYELRQLRLKYSQLERYCKNIQVELLSGSSSNVVKQRTSSQTIINTSTQQNIANDQITFHKQKNRELQQRVDKLLKINTQLKQNLQQLLKQRNQSSNVSYYKEQILQLNQKINVSEIRIKKLLDQNQRLKLSFGNFNKGQQNVQSKLFDYQRKIIELQRTLNQYNLSKISLEKELMGLKQVIQTKQYEINELKKQLSMNGDKQSIALISYRQKIENYQTEITKLTNRVKINESQVQRLNQVIKRKQSQTGEEVARWRIKVSQLQEQINRITSQTESQKSGQSSIKLQMSRLIQQIRSLQYQNQQLKQANQNFLRKLHESDGKFKQLQAQYFDLQNQFMGKRVDETQWNMKFQQYEFQNVKFMNQIQFLKQQIERLNQQAKNKQRNYELQVQNLQGKIGLTEREQLSFKRSTSSWESEKQTYEGQLAKLKSQIALYGAQIQRRQAQFGSKQRVYEQKISMLKTQITQIESNSIILQQNSSSLLTIKQKYEYQIAELRNQVSILKSEIERLNGIAKEKQSLYRSLQTNNSSWNDQKQKYEKQIAKFYNQTNILKQEIQRLKLTIVQRQSIISSIRSGSQSWNLEKQNYEIQITKLSNQIAFFKNQNERLYNKVLEIQNSESSSNSQLEHQISSRNEEIQKYKRQIESLFHQVDTLKQQNQNLYAKSLEIQNSASSNNQVLSEIHSLRNQLQNYENEIARLINQINIQKSENERLNEKISSLQYKFNKCRHSLHNNNQQSSNVQGLQEQNYQLRMQLQNMKQQWSLQINDYRQKINFMSQRITSLAHYIQLSRSVYLELQALFDEKQFSSEDQLNRLNERIGQEIQNGLQIIVAINEAIQVFY